MSQEKVDFYKEQKANRKEIMKKQKFRRRLEILVVLVVVVAAVGWFGTSLYRNHKANAAANASAETTVLDLTEVQAFLTDAQNYVDDGTDAETDTETVSAFSSETGTEAVSASSAE